MDDDDSIFMVCSICCEQYSNEMPPIEIKICKHYFHEQCLENWAKQCGMKGTEAKCPDCRQTYKKEDVEINQKTLSIIIKNNLKIQVNFKMISGEKMELVLDQSRTIQQLFDMLVIYNKPYEQQNLQITVNQKQYTINNKDLLIKDLKLPLDQEVQVSQIESYFQTITVKVKGSMSASDFSKIVSAQTLIPENLFFFTYGGKMFNSSFPKTIDELQIKKDSTVFQVGRLNGG